MKTTTILVALFAAYSISNAVTFISEGKKECLVFDSGKSIDISSGRKEYLIRRDSDLKIKKSRFFISREIVEYIKGELHKYKRELILTVSRSVIHSNDKREKVVLIGEAFHYYLRFKVLKNIEEKYYFETEAGDERLHYCVTNLYDSAGVKRLELINAGENPCLSDDGKYIVFTVSAPKNIMVYDINKRENHYFDSLSEVKKGIPEIEIKE
jgi:hypothetical protein